MDDEEYGFTCFTEVVVSSVDVVGVKCWGKIDVLLTDIVGETNSRSAADLSL